MDYNELTSKTAIHTRINSKYRISSIFRDWDVMCAPYWGWETILWIRENEDDKMEKIAHSESTCGDAQNVVKRHREIFVNISNNNGVWKEDEDEEE